jgi:oligoendopeptidase F
MKLLFPTLSSLTALIIFSQIPALAGTEIRDRAETPEPYKWDLSGFYSNWENWKQDLETLKQLTAELEKQQGTLSSGAEALKKTVLLNEKANLLAYKLHGYVSLNRDIDQRDNTPQGYLRELLAVFSKWSTQSAWIDPEVISIGESTIMGWVEATPELKAYRFHFSNLFRQQQHILDGKSEKLLAYFGALKGIPELTYQALTTADAVFPEITLSNGDIFKVSPGTYGNALISIPNAADRRLIQDARMADFIKNKNTYASLYEGVMQQGWASAQARNYSSTLSGVLDGNNIPESVLTNLIQTAREGASAVQKYHQLRKEFMALENYGWSDMFLPLIEDKTVFSYDETIGKIVDSVALLGPVYQQQMREQFEGRKIDVFESEGKRSGAYNMGIYGVGSFVLLNYHDTMEDAFTVAHEMGHSMHTRLSQENQPFATHDYTIFVAEVASTFNERLFFNYLFERTTEARERVALLEKQIHDIWGTFFIQTMMADYEVQAHALLESGQAITADSLTDLWRSIVKTYYGDIIPENDPYMYTWARIPHLFNSPFYVYQYATCYASSATLLEQIESSPTPEIRAERVNRYLDLLKSGGKDYPVTLLQEAGADLTKPETVQAIVDTFRTQVDSLEQELKKLKP